MVRLRLGGTAFSLPFDVGICGCSGDTPRDVFRDDCNEDLFIYK